MGVSESEATIKDISEEILSVKQTKPENRTYSVSE